MAAQMQLCFRLKFLQWEERAVPHLIFAETKNKRRANNTDATLLKLQIPGYLERGNKREDET